MKLNAALITQLHIQSLASPPSHGMVGRYRVVNQNLEARVATGPGASGGSPSSTVLSGPAGEMGVAPEPVCPGMLSAQSRFAQEVFLDSLFSLHFYNASLPNRSSVNFRFFPFSQVPCLFSWA